MHLAQQPFISENVLDDIKTVCNEQLIGTFNLLEAISSNLKGICFVSSFMVYKGDSVREISETHTLAPQNLYGASKLALESFLRIYSERMNIPLTILRMSSVYGPGDTRKGAVSSFIKSALDGKDLVVYGSGSSFRDYLYVDDAADAIVAATIKNKEGIFNVGTGKKTTILTLAKEIKSMAKNDNLSIRFETKRPDGNCFVLDILKIKKERGFCPVVDKSEGLKRTFIWHKRRILPR